MRARACSVDWFLRMRLEVPGDWPKAVGLQPLLKLSALSHQLSACTEKWFLAPFPLAPFPPRILRVCPAVRGGLCA
jgi:hypothetical protein